MREIRATKFSSKETDSVSSLEITLFDDDDQVTDLSAAEVIVKKDSNELASIEYDVINDSIVFNPGKTLPNG
ncbi:hypothetical protein [Paucilactobacillus sp. N302-9]